MVWPKTRVQRSQRAIRVPLAVPDSPRYARRVSGRGGATSRIADLRRTKTGTRAVPHRLMRKRCHLSEWSIFEENGGVRSGWESRRAVGDARPKMSTRSLSWNIQIVDSASADLRLSPIGDREGARFALSVQPSPWRRIEVSRPAQRAFNGLAKRRDEVPFAWRATPLEILF